MSTAIQAIRVLETESGHMDFSPANEREERLAKAVRGTAATVSWEMMLMLDRHDPVWNQACPDLLESERPRLQAALLGRFAINLMHAFGAWQGVMLTGTRAGRMLETANRVYFEFVVRDPPQLQPAAHRRSGLAGRPARGRAHRRRRTAGATGLQPAISAAA